MMLTEKFDPSNPIYDQCVEHISKWANRNPTTLYKKLKNSVIS